MPHRAAPSDVITRLTEIENDDDEVDAVAEDVEYESSWVAATVLRIHSIVEKGLVSSITKYFAKHPRMWKDSELVDEEEDDEEEDDEDEEGRFEEDDEDEDETEEDAMTPKRPTRKCFVATTTSSLERYYSKLEDVLQASIEQFVQRFKHFGISSIDETSCIEYRSGSFREEAPERKPNTAPVLTALVMLTDTKDEVVFALQNDSTTGEPFKLTANAGDVVIFPACALHPYEVLAKERTTPLRYIQVNIS